MSNLLTAAVAAKALKKDKTSMSPESTPKTLQESIFAKPLTWVVIAGVAIYAVSRLFKKSDVAEEKKDIAKLQQAGQTPTYLDSNYSNFADAIYAARSGNKLFGTDENAIYSIFKQMKNDADIVKLSQAFGTRRLSFSLQDAGLGG
ncbi:MAG: hypothetical protein EBX50_21990, partial [Chitinophagia bacterium]|nr:hypothetical protein [Chitinophagia bacterium]